MSGAPSWQVQQLYALWQQRQVALARWALATLAFAALVPLLVLGPYERTVRASAEVQRRLAAADQQARRAADDAADLTAVQLELSEIADALEAFSWETRRDALRDRMRRLGDAWTTLERADRKVLLEAAALGRESMRIQGIPGDRINMRAPPIEQSNAPAARLEGQARLDGPGELRTVLEAAEVLQLDAEALAGMDDQARSAQLDTIVPALADRLARQSIEDAAEEMRSTLVRPLEALLERHPRARAQIPLLGEAMEGSLSAIEGWRDRYIDDSEWYRTVSGKGETLQSLRHAIDQGPRSLPGRPQSITDQLRDAVRRQESATKAEIARLDEQQSAAKRALEQYQTDLDVLTSRLKSVLPNWISGLISPPELMNLFAPIVIVLLAILAALAWRLRQNYLALRQAAANERVAMEAFAAGSTWTLARRGTAATLATAAVYLGGLLLLWGLFAYGTDLALSFSTLRSDSGLATPESLIDSLIGPPTLPPLRLVGHLAFVAAALLVVASLARVPAAAARDPAG